MSIHSLNLPPEVDVDAVLRAASEDEDGRETQDDLDSEREERRQAERAYWRSIRKGHRAERGRGQR